MMMMMMMTMMVMMVMMRIINNYGNVVLTWLCRSTQRELIKSWLGLHQGWFSDGAYWSVWSDPRQLIPWYLDYVPPLLEVALRQIPPLLSISRSIDHVTPCHCWMSSCHLPLGLLLDLFPCLTCHSVHLTDHLLSFMRATCPAHFHFVWGMTFRVSSTLVLSLILPICFRPDIVLSIFLWRTSILLTTPMSLVEWRWKVQLCARYTKTEKKKCFRLPSLYT